MNRLRVHSGRVRSPLVLAAVGLLCSACASLPQPHGDLADDRCVVTVYNRTPAALEVRMSAGLASARWTGGLNPGEALTRSIPCAEGQVLVRGTPIAQTGLHVSFVQAAGVLVRGRRTDVALHWP